MSIWYDWRDDGADPKDPEHHFGLVRNAYQSGRDPVYEPKPAYRAAKTLSECFSGYVFQQRLSAGADDYVLVFAKGADRRLAAWTTSSAHRLNIPPGIPTANGDFRVIRHTDESAGLASAGPQGISIEVLARPVYLVP